MQLYLTDQIKNFPKHLEVLKKQPVMEFDKCKLKEKSSIISIHTVKQFQDLDTGFLFDYHIFPRKNYDQFGTVHLWEKNYESWRHNCTAGIYSPV